MSFNSKYIASGSYGCVIKPGYNCENNIPKEESVSKIFSDKIEWLYEIKQNKVIEEIDKSNKFTVKMLNNCEISLSYVNKNVKDIYKCEIIEGENKIYQILYENGGIDLRELFIYNKILKYYEKFDIKEFLLEMEKIFEGLYEIEKIGLSHRDIKLDNLLYNGKKISLIDFGLMIEKRKIFDNDNLNIYYKTNIYYYPNEVKLYAIKKLKYSYNYIKLNSNYLTLSIKEFIKTNRTINSNNIYILEIEKIINKLDIDALNYLNFFKNTKQEIDLNKFEKIDVYLLGVVLLELITYIVIYIPKMIIKSEMFKLISEMLEINPYKRITMLEAKELYRKIMNN